MKRFIKGEPERMTQAEVKQALKDTKMLRSSLEEQWKELDEYDLRLYRQFQLCPMRPSQGIEKTDKRKDFNVIRNLKISAAAAYKHAVDSGRTALEGRNRAINAVKQAALAEWKDDKIIAPHISTMLVDGNTISVMDTLPPELETYIEFKFQNYGMKGTKPPSPRKDRQLAVAATAMGEDVS